MKWSAAQALSWIIQQEALELKQWHAELGPKMEAAQRTLASSIRTDKIRAWGRKRLHGSLEEIPSGDFRISGMELIVSPHGGLATAPPHKVAAYEGVQWHDIEFDQAEVRNAWPKPPPSSASEWMREEAQRVLNKTGKPGKRDDLIKLCMAGAPCKKRDAEGAFAKLPEALRRMRGKPPKSSG